MRPKPHKIQAFTLSEMMVVLLITTIVVGMAFAVIQLVQKQMTAMGSTYDHQTEMNSLRLALWTDMHQSDRAFYQSSQRTVELQRNSGLARYQFLEKVVVRDRDTFAIGPYTSHFYFLNREVYQREIDAISIILKDTVPNKKIFVYKSNAATSFMNR